MFKDLIQMHKVKVVVAVEQVMSMLKINYRELLLTFLRAILVVNRNSLKSSMRTWRKSCCMNTKKCKRRVAELFLKTNFNNWNKLNSQLVNLLKMLNYSNFWTKKASSKLNKLFKTLPRRSVKVNNTLMMEIKHKLHRRWTQTTIWIIQQLRLI